jgi:hypothetical protein
MKPRFKCDRHGNRKTMKLASDNSSSKSCTNAEQSATQINADVKIKCGRKWTSAVNLEDFAGNGCYDAVTP